MSDKSPDAFRTISEVADWLGVQPHVLRFWESKFSQVKPVKRAGGRRYYRPADMLLLGGIRKLLHEDGLTIKGAQKILREEGMAHVSAMSPPVDDDGNAVSDEIEDLGPEEVSTTTFADTEQAVPAADIVAPEVVETIPSVDVPVDTEQGESSHDSAPAEPSLPLVDPDVLNAADETTIPTAEPTVQEADAPELNTVDTVDDAQSVETDPDITQHETATDDTAAEISLEEASAEQTDVTTDAPQQEAPLPSFLESSAAAPMEPIEAPAESPPVESAAVLDEAAPDGAEPPTEIEAPEDVVSVSAPEAPPTDLDSGVEATQTEQQPDSLDSVQETGTSAEPETVLPSFMRAKPTPEAIDPETALDQPVGAESTQSADMTPELQQAGQDTPEPPRARVVEAPDPIDSDLSAYPDTLSAAFSLQDTTPDMVTKITPLIAQLAALRDRMAAERGR